jgi:hypothetical protein
VHVSIVRDVQRVGAGELRGTVLLPVRPVELLHPDAGQGALHGRPAGLVRFARNRHRLRKARRVRDVDDDERLQGELIKALPRRSSREWGELTRAASVGAEGRARVMSSRSSDPAEKVWNEMYQVGLWGFGRLSLTSPTAWGGGDSEDGDDAVAQ